MRRPVLCAKQYRAARNGGEGQQGHRPGRAPARRAGAGHAQPPARAPVRLFAAAGAGGGRPADRGRHALSAPPAARGPGPAAERVGHLDGAATALLPAESGRRTRLRGPVRRLARPGRGDRWLSQGGQRAMMTADDVIESYVRDVARLLPHKRRDDVALELRALLQEELAAKAEAAGRPQDQAMAMALLAGFGRPAEAAARYEPRKPLIDPED